MKPRKPVPLKHDAEMGEVEIAKALGVSVAYVSQTIARGFKRLEKSKKYRAIAKDNGYEFPKA
jgi:DNA-directed RNA polymerase specialized sigma subunit